MSAFTTNSFIRMASRAALVLALGATVVACADMQNNPKTTAGTLLGGVGGAAIGSQFGKGTGQIVGVAAGTLLGALIGSEVGKSLDRADRTYMAQSTQASLETAPSGQVTTWRNPDNGNYGTVVPQAAYQNAGGQYCREYQQTVTVGGQTERAFGTACRQPDGSWKIVSQ